MTVRIDMMHIEIEEEKYNKIEQTVEEFQSEASMSNKSNPVGLAGDNDQMRMMVTILAHQPLKAKSVQSSQRLLSTAKCKVAKKQENSWGRKRGLQYKIWYRKNDCMISIQEQNVHTDHSHNDKIIFDIIFLFE